MREGDVGDLGSLSNLAQRSVVDVGPYTIDPA